MEITASAYVVANMYLMTRIGKPALKRIEQRQKEGLIPALGAGVGGEDSNATNEAADASDGHLGARRAGRTANATGVPR